jgi:hypothetical protein
MPRPFHRSLRATLLHHANTPVWTGARWLESGDFLRPFRTIAVGLDGRDASLNHVRLAASFASHVGAELRLLTTVPHIDEGTLLSGLVGSEPLSESAAKQRAKELFSGWSQMPKVDVALGAPETEIPRMAQRCGADLLFLNESQSCGGIFSRQISRTVDESPCGVIAIPASLPQNFQWTFANPAAHARHAGAIVEMDRGKATSPRLLSKQSR